MKKTDLSKIGMKYKGASIENYDAGSRTISGFAAIFGNVDRDGDMLLRGCFAKSIADRGPESEANGKILLLWQHEASNPIGKITVLREDEKGLYFEAEIDEIETGDRAIKQLESGTLNQFSIGFSYVWEKCSWETDTDTGEEYFVVGEVKLYEISVVSIAANPETEFLGMKAADTENVQAQISRFAKGMPIDKQQDFLKIISCVKSLAAAVPPEAHVQEQAEETRESIFDIFANQ